MPVPYQRIIDYMAPYYGRDEFPVLLEQCREWSMSRPFEGKRLLDGSPVFRNTCLKYAALLAGGAELDVAVTGAVPHDPQAVRLLDEFAIPVVTPGKRGESYDVVLDCGGALCDVPSRFGYVELTKSGESRYRSVDAPVWMADGGMIKKIETCLGTGESFFRAMEQEGHDGWESGPLLVIGYGKVGRGIVMYALRHGIEVVVSDICHREVPPGVGFIFTGDRELFNRELGRSYCAVTATGVRHALEGIVDADVVRHSSVLLANMGVEDEWGGAIPDERVLNGKTPLNFILDDPTRMCFIDPPMALHNFGASELIHMPDAPRGLILPSDSCERRIMQAVLEAGRIPLALLKTLPSS